MSYRLLTFSFLFATKKILSESLMPAALFISFLNMVSNEMIALQNCKTQRFRYCGRLFVCVRACSFVCYGNILTG